MHPANQSLLLKEEYWPVDSRWVRTAFLASDEGQARPDTTARFILARDNEVILTVTGNAGWKNKMWPRILEVTGRKT